jgi:pyruvate ferredoxin oxidoreductase gamma subunit
LNYRFKTLFGNIPFIMRIFNKKYSGRRHYIYMSKMMEIRWHGRGGQGAKTAAMLLAEAALDAGKFIQAFPEYGPERAGAPIRAFTRISDDKIDIHCAVTNPHIVVVIDPTLVGPVNVTDGIDEDGLLLVNTNKTPGEIREMVNMKGGKVYTVDASKIALETLGRDLPNTPMLGALVAATSLIDQRCYGRKNP